MRSCQKLCVTFNRIHPHPLSVLYLSVSLKTWLTQTEIVYVVNDCIVLGELLTIFDEDHQYVDEIKHTRALVIADIVYFFYLRYILCHAIFICSM